MKLIGLERSSLLLELMDCIDELVLIVDSRFRVRGANRVALVSLGYTSAGVIKKNLFELIAAEEREKTAELILAAKERLGGETVLLTRSNRKIPVRFSLSYLSGTGDKLREYLFVGRRSGKACVSSGVDPLSGLEIRMLKGFADPLFVIDGASRTVRECNDAALAATGFSRDELVGRRLFDHARSAEERQRNRAVEARADRVYATAGMFQERILLPRKGDSPLPCDLAGFPLFGLDESLHSIVVILFDRSAEEEREAQLADLIGQVSALAAELTVASSSYSTRSRSKSLLELGFTSRQIEIVRLCASGASSKEIGYRLGLAVSTVKNHLSAIYRKLGVNSRIGLIRILAAERIKLE
jgi:PAS domain S-box-containing protein